MDPDDKASEELAGLRDLLRNTFPVDVVESHLGSSAGGSNAKQVPELPPEAKQEVPKAKRSKGLVKSCKWPPQTSPIPEGMGTQAPQTPSQGSPESEPSSDDSRASPKSVADNKKAKSTFPPPVPAHPPKLQHYLAQHLPPPPRPPPAPPNMQHHLEQGVWDEPEKPEPRPPELHGQKIQALLAQSVGWSCYPKRDEPETHPPSVAAHAPQPPLVAAHTPQHEGGHASPPAFWREIMQQGGYPPGLPPGYTARPKKQAEFPWRVTQHASPIAPPLLSTISPSMAGFYNVSTPPPAFTAESQQARPSTASRVMPPPPPVLPATRNAEIPSVKPTQAPSTRTTGPNRESGGTKRNWYRQLRFAESNGEEARKEFIRRYGHWHPKTRQEDDAFLEQYRRDNPEVDIRCA